jgi:hypothetical protein
MTSTRTKAATKRANKSVTLGRLLLGEWVSVPVWVWTYTNTRIRDNSQVVGTDYSERLAGDSEANRYRANSDAYKAETLVGFVVGSSRLTDGSTILDICVNGEDRVSVRFGARGKKATAEYRFAGPASVRVVRPPADVKVRGSWLLYLLTAAVGGRRYRVIPVAETVRDFGAEVFGSAELADTVAGLCDGWDGSVGDLIETARALS